MKRMNWILALSLTLILAIAGFAFAQAGPDAGPGGPGPHGHGPHGHGGPGGPGGDFGFGPGGMHFGQLVQRLNLTQDQQDKLKGMMKQHMQQNRGQGQAAEAAHDALAKELFKDQPNQAEIQKQLTILQQDQAQRMGQWVQMAQDANKILTPEQRVEMQKMIDERSTARANMKQKMMERRQQREQQKDDKPTAQ